MRFTRGGWTRDEDYHAAGARRFAPRAGDPSPWGTIEEARVIAPGLVSVSTAGHGGYWISAQREERIPAAARSPFLRQAGWYEEDVDAAVPAYLWPEAFRADAAGQADVRERAAACLRGAAAWGGRYGPVCEALGIALEVLP